MTAARKVRLAGREERGTVLAEVLVPDEVAAGLTEEQVARQLTLYSGRHGWRRFRPLIRDRAAERG